MIDENRKVKFLLMMVIALQIMTFSVATESRMAGLLAILPLLSAAHYWVQMLRTWRTDTVTQGESA